MTSKKQKIFSVSATKLGSFRRCRQQYKWKYVDKYYTRSSVGQLRGTCGHSALAVWHSLYDRELALNAAWDKWSLEGNEHDDNWILLETSLLRYFDWSQANDTFKLLIAEKEFNIEFTIGKGISNKFIFTGFIDGIVEEKGANWILENKFYQKMSDPSDMDAQVSLYMLAATLLDYKVQGVIYNMVRVADTKIAVSEPVVRKRIFKSPAGLEKVQNEMIDQVNEMKQYHQKGVTYRSVTKDCGWDCAFHQACLSMSDDGLEPTRMLEIISNKRSDTNGQE